MMGLATWDIVSYRRHIAIMRKIISLIKEGCTHIFHVSCSLFMLRHLDKSRKGKAHLSSSMDWLGANLEDTLVQSQDFRN